MGFFEKKNHQYDFFRSIARRQNPPFPLFPHYPFKCYFVSRFAESITKHTHREKTQCFVFIVYFISDKRLKQTKKTLKFDSNHTYLTQSTI